MKKTKKYNVISILTSISAFCSVSLIFCVQSFSDTIPEIKEVVVSRSLERSLDITGSGTHIITRDDIDRLALSDISELLDTSAGITLNERGTPGSQADLSIRGSSFEGVLLLINGVRSHDPQTGHFLMDIPIDINAVERIEIMPGGGSSIYGSSASGGVINIVTRKNRQGFDGGLSLGSFGTGKTSMAYSTLINGHGLSLSAQAGRSDGYESGFDLESTSFNAGGNVSTGNTAIDWNAGFVRKEFGAKDFYAPYPSFEKTETLHAGANVRHIINSNNSIRFRLGGRGHGDDFILVRDNPALYRNKHYNRSYSLAAEYLSTVHDNGSLTIGAETERSGITSQSLRHHRDYNNSLYGEYSAKATIASLSLSMRYDINSRDEKILSPGLGVVVPVGDGRNIRFRVERSFRAPTYTELFYVSPANMGDPDLKSERSISGEAGFDIVRSRYSAGLSAFVRRSDNAIDWIRYSKESPWQAANHGELKTVGVELKSRISVAESWIIHFNTVVLDQRVSRQKGTESKYALNTPEKIATASVTGPLPAGLKSVVSIRYEDMVLSGSRTPVDLKLMKQINNYRFVASALNIFNERYEEIPGLPAPGRWLTLGVERDID